MLLKDSSYLELWRSFSSAEWKHLRNLVEGIMRKNSVDFFCSGIQFNLLLSPYPCFISLLYLDLYVLGDDALIS